MSFKLRFSNEARKQISRLDQPLQRRIIERAKQLAEDPYNSRISKRLHGAKDRSARVGDWRIIYETDDAAQTVWVLVVVPRGRAYRRV